MQTTRTGWSGGCDGPDIRSWCDSRSFLASPRLREPVSLMLLRGSGISMALFNRRMREDPNVAPGATSGDWSVSQERGKEVTVDGLTCECARVTYFMYFALPCGAGFDDQ